MEPLFSAQVGWVGVAVTVMGALGFKVTETSSIHPLAVSVMVTEYVPGPKLVGLEPLKDPGLQT